MTEQASIDRFLAQSKAKAMTVSSRGNGEDREAAN